MSNLCDELHIHDNIYTNMYSLWGNSKYYDIKNLSPQNFANRNGTIGSEISQEIKALQWAASTCEVLTLPNTEDSFSARTVARDSLYQDIGTFGEKKDSDSTESPTKTRQQVSDWTQFYWQKATEKAHDRFQDGAGPSSRGRRRPGSQGRAQKHQPKVISPADKPQPLPVKMTKAESMMQKMGWEGGALGKGGEGIVEPIAPNATYARTKIGFGQNHIQIIRPPKNKKAMDAKQCYEINVLHNIYEFVKNNSEVELLFDNNLKKEERKLIHKLVQCKLNCHNLRELDGDSSAEMELMWQISDKNCYILRTQSFGTQPWRQLCLYKAAPPDVYLIVPDDLREEDEEAEETKDPPEEEETNPFLRSITRNLKKECQEEVPKAPVKFQKVPEDPFPGITGDTRKIVHFFIEFAADKGYTQFKFLGPFSEAEFKSINEFLELAAKYLKKEPCVLESVFQKVAFCIKEDCTGNTVILKRPI